MSSTVRAAIDHIAVTAADTPLASLVTDNGDELTIPAALLPNGVTVGDVLLIRFTRDEDETALRAARVSELQRKLFG